MILKILHDPEYLVRRELWHDSLQRSLRVIQIESVHWNPHMTAHWREEPVGTAATIERPRTDTSSAAGKRSIIIHTHIICATFAYICAYPCKRPLKGPVEPLHGEKFAIY